MSKSKCQINFKAQNPNFTHFLPGGGGGGEGLGIEYAHALGVISVSAHAPDPRLPAAGVVWL